MAFSGIDGRTDFESGIVARTSFDGAAIDIKIPCEARLEFHSAKPSKVFLGGDFFILDTEGGKVRGAFLDTHHILIEGDAFLPSSDKLELARKGGLSLLGVKGHFNPALLDYGIEKAISERMGWLEKIEIPSALSGSRRKTLLKALSIMKTQVCSPEGRVRRRWTTPDRWPHRQMWLWDSGFHSLGWRHIDKGMARDAIEAMLEARSEDGFIPHMAGSDGGSSITQPPVLAYCASLVDEEWDLEWLRRIYPALRDYVEWDFRNRDSDGGGLCEWFIEESPTCRSGESGMDNSPRFDSATALDATDFNAFLALECETLSSMAKRLGLPKDERHWLEKRDAICSLINKRFWNDGKSFYFDFDVASVRMSEVMASSGFLPLLCGAPNPEMARRLARHLSNPETFGTPLSIPSIAACDTKSYSKDMWRGPVWININWLVARGLERYGMRDEAASIDEATMAEIERMYLKYGSIFEYYDDRRQDDPPKLMRKGQSAASSPSPYHQPLFDYGWSVTLYVDMAFRYLRQ